MKSKIFTKKKASKASDLPEDDEEDSWLDEPEVYPVARVLNAEKSSPINLSASVHL